MEVYGPHSPEDRWTLISCTADGELSYSWCEVFCPPRSLEMMARSAVIQHGNRAREICLLTVMDRDEELGTWMYDPAGFGRVSWWPAPRTC